MKTPTVDIQSRSGTSWGRQARLTSDEEPKKGEETKPKEPSYESDIENILDRKRAQTPPG